MQSNFIVVCFPENALSLAYITDKYSNLVFQRVQLIIFSFIYIIPTPVTLFQYCSRLS